MTTDQFIALGASVGACLSAVATLWTVRQMARQREASYKPELALSRTFFRSVADPLAKGSLPVWWTEPEGIGSEPAVARRPFTVPLRNIGLGTAKKVEVSWSFQIADMVETANQLAQRSLTPAYFSYEAGALHLDSDSVGRSVSMWQNQQHDSIDYVMPAAVESKPVLLRVPHAYIQLVSALIFFAAKDKGRKAFPDIPALSLKLEYRDIGDQKHGAGFEVGCELGAFTGEGEILSGSLEFTKAV